MMDLFRTCLVVFVLPLSINCFILDSIFGKPPQTVPSLDLSKYLGRWYQMIASQSVVSLWESNAYCVTADYEQTSNGNVTVLNSERLYNATGPLKTIHGYAVPTAEAGKFSVHLETVPIGAPYWILKLGPASYGDKLQYQYAIVSDNIRGTLFVLARNSTLFHNDYETEIVKFLDANGFKTFYNKAINTYHGDDCVYNTDHH